MTQPALRGWSELKLPTYLRHRIAVTMYVVPPCPASLQQRCTYIIYKRISRV